MKKKALAEKRAKQEERRRQREEKRRAKEEEKRIYNGSAMNGTNGQFGQSGLGGPGMNQNSMYGGVNEAARQQALSQANDPNKHL